METGNANVRTISLIMEVEEVTPEEIHSDSDSIEFAVMRHSNTKDSNKKLPEGSETSCSVKVINKPESVGRKSLEDSIKGKITTSKEETSQNKALGQNIVFAKKAYSATSSSEDSVKIQSLPEIRLGGVSSGEVMNTGSLEEKLSAMFEEDKHESKKPVNNEDQCGPTLEEQLTELFQDKSECDEIPSSTTEVVSTPIEENLIAIFEEEEDSGKSLSSQVYVPESKPHRKEHVKGPETSIDKELSYGKGCAVLLENKVQVSSQVSKTVTEKKTPSLKRKITEKEADHITCMKKMKNAIVILKKLELSTSDVGGIKLNKLPNIDIEKSINHKPVDKNNSLSQNSMTKLSDEKQNEFVPKVSTFKKSSVKISPLSTATKTKTKAADKITLPTDSLNQQEIKKKKSVRISNRNSTETSQSEKLKLKPEKQPVKAIETLPNLETTKPKSSESSKAPVKEQPIPEALKRKRGRPPVNRSKETVLSSKTDKRKPAKTVNKVQESALVSRVSERLQLKLMKTRAVRKRKLRGDKFEGTSIKLQKPSQKREHILKLHRTAISLAKKRKTTTFTTYGLARKRRLLNAVKTASIKRKQSSAPLMNIKQTAVKHKGPVIKEDNMDNLPKLTVALTPVLLKSSGNLAKTTLKAKSIHSDTSANKKNTDVKTSHLSVETNFSDSEAEQKNTQKKSEHKVTKPIPLKRLMVTRSKGELGQKQQKKGVQLKSIPAVKDTNKKKIDGNPKTGSVSMEIKKKSITACGVEIRNNEGVVELLVEDANNLTANNMNDRGTGETTMPGKASSASQKNSFTVEVPSGMTDAQKMFEMRKAIWNLETRIDRYKLRQQAEERMVVYLSNKLHFYENNKYVQALMRMLKDAAPGPEQNQDAVFITDLLLGYCPDNDNYEKES